MHRLTNLVIMLNGFYMAITIISVPKVIAFDQREGFESNLTLFWGSNSITKDVGLLFIVNTF
jgi:hypothetical protein